MDNSSDNILTSAFTAGNNDVELKGKLSVSSDSEQIDYDEKSLIVIFPGRDREPDLFNSIRTKLFKTPTDVLDIDYGNLPWNQDSRELAEELILKILEDVNTESYKNIIFLGFSVGTIFSSDLTKLKYHRAFNILLSPIDGALNAMKDISFTAFSGTEDSRFTNELAKLHLKKKYKNIEFLDKINHFLEYKSHERSLELQDELLKSILNIIKKQTGN